MFTPFAFVNSIPSVIPNSPEDVGDLYYWWDFTDTGSITFSGSTQVIASIDNKAVRTSSNETLSYVSGSPSFTSIASGSRFTTSDSIGNANVGGGGQLDTLSSGVDATVVWIGKIVGYNEIISGMYDNQLWAWAGSGSDDMAGTIATETSTAPAGYHSCSSDNAISATYNIQWSWHDWLTTVDEQFVFRTYQSSSVNPTNQYNLVAWAIDTNASGYNSVNISANGQAFCDITGIAGNRSGNLTTSRGFKINSRSRSGTPNYTANQYIQHLFIYNGLLTSDEINSLYLWYTNQ